MPEWNPGRNSRGTVSPWWPTITGRRVAGRFAAYSRQFSLNSHTRNPKMPGILPMTMVAVSHASAFSNPNDCSSTPVRVGIIGSSSLWAMVTTGKCLSGLICGSTNRVMMSRRT